LKFLKVFEIEYDERYIFNELIWIASLTGFIS
jgi:hypothetical protein